MTHISLVDHADKMPKIGIQIGYDVYFWVPRRPVRRHNRGFLYVLYKTVFSSCIITALEFYHKELVFRSCVFYLMLFCTGFIELQHRVYFTNPCPHRPAVLSAVTS